MNSWKSTGLSACTPPLRTLSIGHRQQRGLFVAEVAPQRLSELGGPGTGDGERHAEDRIRAEPRLGVGAVKLDQRPVEAGLVAGVAARDQLGDLTVDVPHGVQDGLASV